MSGAPTYESTLKYHELADEQMKVECSDGVILALVQQMRGWRNIAPHLEVDDSVVDAMAVDEERKRRELLKCWKVKFGHEATLERLARSFISAGKAALADLVCEERKLLLAAPAATPQLTAATPQLTAATPQLPTATPQLTSASPQLTSATPQFPTATPQFTAATPQLTSATPQLTSATPQLTAATPQLTSASPQLTSATPQLTAATPQLTSATPQLTSATPQLTSATPQLTSAIPQPKVVSQERASTSIDSSSVDPSPGAIVSPLATPQLPAVSEEKVAEVRESIEQFEDEFSRLKYGTRKSLREREKQDPDLFDMCQAYLRDLPASKKKVHIKFFGKHKDDILKAENIDKILDILVEYCDYRNYELILPLIRMFCEAALKQRMLDYKKSFQSFEMDTTVDVYLCAISAHPEGKTCRGFTQMALKLNKSTSQCTLHEIRQLTNDIAEEASIPSYCVYIGGISESSVMVVLGIHPGCVESVVMTMTPDFQQTHHLTEVSIDGRDITLCRPDVQLRDASKRGDREEVISLISAGADVNYQSRDGMSALMRAASEGHTAVVQELVKSGATLDIQNKDGWSALMMAAMCGHTAVVQELVKSGATLDIQNENGDSAVMMAIQFHHSDTLQELVRAGADLNLVNQEGLTALMMAARSGRTELVDILLTGENINIDYQIDTGWSSLFFSAEAGHVATTQSLLRAGANPHLKDKDGLTVLDVATASERKEVCELLRNYLPSTSTTRRFSLSQDLKTLAKRSGQRVKQLFIQLVTRLKSTDLKTEHQRPGVRGQLEWGAQRKKRFIRTPVPSPRQPTEKTS